MKSIFKIIFLFIFVSSWGPTGGIFVRYPLLESALNRVSHQNPSVLKDVRTHSNPSTLCGVKAVVDSLGHVGSDLLKSIFQMGNALLPISSFRLEVKNISSFISDLSYSRSVQKFFILPFAPPKINHI